MATLTGQSAIRGPELAWRDLRGDRVTVHALPGSYAAARAPDELRAAERVIGGLEELLKPPTSASRRNA